MYYISINIAIGAISLLHTGKCGKRESERLIKSVKHTWNEVNKLFEVLLIVWSVGCVGLMVPSIVILSNEHTNNAVSLGGNRISC